MLARLPMICCVALLALVPAACGGEAGDEDVDALLQETFSSDKQVDSGRLSLVAAVDARGSERVQQPVRLEIRGPFRETSPDEVPEFDLDATVSTSGLTYDAGATIVDDKGYVLFQDEDYVLSGELFEQFKSGFREGHKDGSEPADPASLGIDPRRWLRNARNAGEAEVAGQDTIKLTGDVDVPELVDDLAAAKQADPGAKKKPTELSEAQQKRIEEAVDAMRVEIYTGADDKILRRIVLAADVSAPEGEESFDSAKVRLDYTLSELNEDQEIEAPTDPQPFEGLVRQLRGLGIGGDAAKTPSRADRRRLERYSRCVERAGSDDAAVRECADRL